MENNTLMPIARLTRIDEGDGQGSSQDFAPQDFAPRAMTPGEPGYIGTGQPGEPGTSRTQESQDTTLGSERKGKGEKQGVGNP
eukprot:132737-Prymnesium_polylepis.1